MKFSEMPYQRVTYETLKKQYLELVEECQNKTDVAGIKSVLQKKYALQEQMTDMELCYVRHDMDVNDPFYAKEQEYYDEIGPMLTELENQFNKILLDSKHREAAAEILGPQAMAILENSVRGFHESIIELAQEENVLTARHNQITSTAEVEWKGKRVKRSLMTQYVQAKERETRKEAALACSNSWEKQRAELEDIYEKLVHNRTKQAKKLGFANYVELGYCRMNRIGYTSEDVRSFRDAVKQEIVPLLLKAEEKRKERLGLDHLYYYDNGISFLEGNPVPLGDTRACLAATKEMYHRLSPETAEFIDFMIENELYDVDIRDGKRGGGYMMSLERYRAPFIFANFDGTSENAYIMTHEGGHAFQYYLKRNEPVREQSWLNSEVAETHAMAMEFFTAPYMELFFGDRAEDYRTLHLEKALQLIAYECEQDEFQQLVFENPDMTPKERNALWRRLDKEYMPFRDYAEDENLKNGCGWQRIPHIFQWPFYAIDYALAQVCALSYQCMMKEDGDAAWQSYLTFCKKSGTMDFKKLQEEAGLPNPFECDTLRKIAAHLKEK
ncbi:MAG: M3 family oligoendopeptidase [Agathobacter sp.]